MRFTGIRRWLALGATAAASLSLAACGGSGSEDETSSAAAGGDAPAWCGTKEVRVGLADGNGNNTWQRLTRYIAEAEAKKCPNVAGFTYTDGQGDTQKAISDVQGQVAQGVNALVVFPHQGKAMLPALRSATKAGVTVVPYRSPVGGRAGRDYTQFVSTDSVQYGRLWGEWIVERLPRGGKVLYLGGPAGVAQSLERLKGMKSVLDDRPNIELIGQQPFNVTDWDPAKTQQVLTSALARFPQIDLIAADYGQAFASSIDVFEQAGRKIPPVATEDSNQLACDWRRLRKDNPDFELYTNSSQNWMVRTAVQAAIAKAAGGTPPAELSVKNATAEDSASGKPKQPECNRDLPPDAILSSGLSPEQVAEAVK